MTSSLRAKLPVVIAALFVVWALRGGRPEVVHAPFHGDVPLVLDDLLGRYPRACEKIVASEGRSRSAGAQEPECILKYMRIPSTAGNARSRAQQIFSQALSAGQQSEEAITVMQGGLGSRRLGLGGHDCTAALGMCHGTVQALGLPWMDFRSRVRTALGDPMPDPSGERTSNNRSLADENTRYEN